MQWICHDWSDGQCEKLLKNCYKAVPDKGKVIVAESILPEDPNSRIDSSWAAQCNLLMLTQTPGGKERSEEEFIALAKKTGFKLVKVCRALGIWVMEFHK